jgi:hypothetical protein
MRENSKRILEERLEAFRQYLEAEIRLEQAQLDEELQHFVEVEISEIKRRMEESIQKAVEYYDQAMVQADGYSKDPALARLGESARHSAKKMMDAVIAAHQRIAEKGIRAIRAVMRQHESRSKPLQL